VPVTAKLSQKFYQRLGDEIATELVEWFNAVDATYRSDVRAIADAQSARIDAQFGQLRAELRQELGTLESSLRRDLVGLESKLSLGLGGLESKLNQEIGNLRGEMRAGLADLKSELLRWMFFFWVGSVGAALLLKLL
jgi:hypothetical protein